MHKKIIAGVVIWLILVAISVSFHRLGAINSKRQGLEDEWITYYYRHPQPGNLIPRLEFLLQKRRQIGHPAYFGPLAHFVSTIIQEDRNRLEGLKLLRDRSSGKVKEAVARIIVESENYKPVDLRYPADLELLWSEFKATGKEEIVEKIVKIMNPTDVSGETELCHAAKDFLVLKATLHYEVYNLLNKKDSSSDGRMKEELKEVLDRIKFSAADPAEKHVVRGVNLTYMGKYDAALKQFKKALNYFPDYALAYGNMANAYELKGMQEEAFRLMKQAVEMEPENATACFGIGRHYFRLNKYDEALQYFLKALKDNPKNHTYNHAVARCYQCKGDTENAVFYFKKYLEYASNGEHVHLVRQYLASVGRPVEEDPADIVVMLKRKKYDSLEKHLSSLLREKSKDEEGRSLLSNAYHKLCFNPDAKHSFETWLTYFKDLQKQDESSHFANACLGLFYIQYAWHARGTGWANTIVEEGRRLFKERLLIARDYLEKTYESDHSDPIVPARLIDVALGLGLAKEEMEKQFQRAILADPADIQAYREKLIYLMPKWYGSEEQMFDFAKEAAKTAPPNSIVPLVLAEAHWEMYYRSDDRASYFKNPMVWYEVKNVYFTLIKRYPDSREVHNRLAVAAYLAGDYEITRNELRVIKDDWLEDVWGNKKFFEKIKKEVSSTSG